MGHNRSENSHPPALRQVRLVLFDAFMHMDVSDTTDAMKRLPTLRDLVRILLLLYVWQIQIIFYSSGLLWAYNRMNYGAGTRIPMISFRLHVTA